MKAATEAAISRRANLIFQSTPPVKAATQWNIVLGKSYQFQSTPPVKAATRLSARERKLLPISIHAAREGGDSTGDEPEQWECYFNPRRP